MKENITDADISDSLQRICCRLDRGRRKCLTLPERFIEHLVRHEIEHVVFGRNQSEENMADDEALRKMNFKEESTGF